MPGEVVFRVGELSLSPPGEDDDPAAVLQADAVRLFVERAGSCAPGFELDTGNARTVAEICRRLDGMPLAIELAARRTGALPLSDILAGLDDQLALLTDGSRTGPGRHRELAAAIDWSHRLLDPEEQTLFRRLAVLVGGFDAVGAAAVCADGEMQPRACAAGAVRAGGQVLDRTAAGPGGRSHRAIPAVERHPRLRPGPPRRLR